MFFFQQVYPTLTLLIAQNFHALMEYFQCAKLWMAVASADVKWCVAHQDRHAIEKDVAGSWFQEDVPNVGVNQKAQASFKARELQNNYKYFTPIITFNIFSKQM